MKDLQNLEWPALSYQPNLLDILFDRMPMGIAIFDRDLVLLRCNPTWASFVERYAPPSVGPVAPGVHFFDLAPGNEASILPLIERVLAGETVRQDTLRLENDGIVSYWDVMLTPLVEDGQVVGIMSVSTDAKRKQAEEALQANERFRLLVMNIPDVIWTTDCEGKTTFISPNVEQVYGFTPEEIYQAGNRLWLERIHPEDLERVKEAYESLFARNEMFDVEYRIQRKDGGWIWLHDRAIATYEKDGVMYADGVFSDITERVRAEEALRKERDFISAVLDTAGALVVVLDREGRIVRFNRACEKTTGYSFDEMRDKPFWNLLLIPEEVEPVKAVFEELRAGQFPKEYENYWVTKDGKRRLIAWSNTAILGADGATEYVIGTGIDITQRKQAEEALRKARDELELRVEERTAELRRANESLKEQFAERKQAERALQERLAFEKLISDISTEFINLGPDEIDAGIQHALEAIGRFADVDRSYVFLLSGDGTTMDNTHEWCRPGIESQIQNLQAQPIETLPWSTARIKRLETVHISRVADLPQEAKVDQEQMRGQDIQSLILVPMVYRGVAVGFLGFDSVRVEKTWTEDIAALLRIVGEIIANALEHKRAQAIQAGQRQFLELLATGRGFSETLHALVRLIEEQWPGMLGLILLLDKDGKHLHIGAAVSLPEEYTQSIEGLEIGPMVGSCGTACYQGERVIVEDIATDPRWEGLRDLGLRYGLRACWSEPVFSSGGQVVGTFAMYYRQPRAPTEAELRTIEMAAHLVGVAIEHKRAQEALQAAYQTLERRVEERTHELAALNAISAVVSRSLDLKEVMNAALDKTLEVMGMDLGVAYRLEGDRDSASQTMLEDDSYLSPMAYRGLSEEFFHRLSHLPLRGTMIERAATTGQPVVWQAAQYPIVNLKQELEREGVELGISAPLLVKGKLVGAIFIATRTMRLVKPEELSLLAAIGQQIGVAIENARLYEAERDRREEAERRRQVAEGLREILTVLNSKQSLDETLDHIVTQACRLLGSDAASILQLQGKDGSLKIQSACGLDADYVSSLSLPIGRGGAGRALAERQPVTLPNAAAFVALLAHEPDTTLDIEKVLLERLISRGYLALLSVPLIVKNEDYGAITLYYREPRDFSEEEIRLAMSVADQVALAIESARLREQAEQSAAMAERSRLARELHDSVTQALYSVTLFAEAAAILLTDGKNLEAADHLRELRDTAQEALREMRLLIFELRPLALEKTGLVAALQMRLEAVEVRGGMKAELQVEGEGAERLPFTVQEELYHIAQEALNNVVKHARAQHVRVHLQFLDTAISLEVWDDGVGFEPEGAQEGGGLGLRGMKERAQRIGGKLQIESAPGKGTKVSIEVPIHPSESLGIAQLSNSQKAGGMK